MIDRRLIQNFDWLFLSLTLAPIVLVVGYCVLIPWAILLKDNPAPPFTTREAQSGPSRNPNPRA